MKKPKLVVLSYKDQNGLIEGSVAKFKNCQFFRDVFALGVTMETIPNGGFIRLQYKNAAANSIYRKHATYLLEYFFLM